MPCWGWPVKFTSQRKAEGEGLLQPLALRCMHIFLTRCLWICLALISEECQDGFVERWILYSNRFHSVCKDCTKEHRKNDILELSAVALWSEVVKLPAFLQFCGAQWTQNHSSEMPWSFDVLLAISNDCIIWSSLAKAKAQRMQSAIDLLELRILQETYRWPALTWERLVQRHDMTCQASSQAGAIKSRPHGSSQGLCFILIISPTMILIDCIV